MSKSKEARRAKVEKVMHEFKKGKLHSGSGKLVKDRKQAIAIALSMAGESVVFNVLDKLIVEEDDINKQIHDAVGPLSTKFLDNDWAKHRGQEKPHPEIPDDFDHQVRSLRSEPQKLLDYLKTIKKPVQESEEDDKKVVKLPTAASSPVKSQKFTSKSDPTNIKPFTIKAKPIPSYVRGSIPEFDKYLEQTGFWRPQGQEPTHPRGTNVTNLKTSTRIPSREHMNTFTDIHIDNLLRAVDSNPFSQRTKDKVSSLVKERGSSNHFQLGTLHELLRGVTDSPYLGSSLHDEIQSHLNTLEAYGHPDDSHMMRLGQMRGRNLAAGREFW